MNKNLVIVVVFAILMAVIVCLTPEEKEIAKVVVTGNSSVELKADMVRFYVRISELADTTKKAQQAANIKISQILDILKKHNVSDENIKTQSLEISTSYSWEDGKQTKIGENVSQSLYITLLNIADFASVVDELGEVAGVSLYSVSFDVADKTSALEKARVLAFEDAKEKAQIYCKVSGTKLGKPVLINESYSTYNARTVADFEEADNVMSLKATAYGTNTEVRTGQISIKVNLNCEFELK